MSNSNALINATSCCYGGSFLPTNTTCCTAGEKDEDFHRAQERGVVAVLVLSLLVFGICLLAVVSARLREKQEIAHQVEENMALHERKEERRRKRQEFVSNGLIVKEWDVPDDPRVESRTEGDQDTPPLGDTVEAPQSPPAPTVNNSSSPTACAMGSDDCESFAAEEDMAGCAICLSPFRPRQLVCKSNNSSCQHVFHEDCMVEWLTKDNENCPMCREVYLLKTDQQRDEESKV
jgi:hypothetical protein